MITTTHEYAYFNGHALTSGGLEGWRYCRDLHVHVLITETHKAVVWHKYDDTDRLEICPLGSNEPVMTRDYGLGACGAQPFDDAAAFLGQTAHVAA